MFSCLKAWVPRLVALTERFPWVIPLFGFSSGLASFFLVERKEQLAQFIAVFMLVSWAWLTLEKVLRRSVAQWFGVQLPAPLLGYFTQLVHQESLFFIIPFFFISTAWNTGQSVFTSLLFIAALVSIIDPIYFRWLSLRRWFYLCFHGITLFAVLLTALPIIFQLPTAKTYVWSLAIALAITLPSVAVELPWRWWQRLVIIGVVALITLAIALKVRPWMPPATLWLTQAAVSSQIDSNTRAPLNQLKIVEQQQLQRGLYAYTSIRAPRGLNERIYHEWRLNGQLVDKVPLDISGGRAAGYRAWSHKMNFPQQPLGRWQVRVVTETDQLIGIVRFRVVEQRVGDTGQRRAASSASSSLPALAPDAAMKEKLKAITE
ncbi:DUF5924 family protein [Cellvibrio fontiphilus]|uniref:DUF5924 family protein n=1 Tax=Cellvibrio fontiphilus TaxID=1815559 RepID=A0ABV7FFF5_9GAMM